MITVVFVLQLGVLNLNLSFECILLRIWVVAPIKRAVDDGTAKELMGEQFKRRLLMDGQYGNTAFICTHTDDCEATEIMRDHKHIAVRVPDMWEKMTRLRDKINGIETRLSDYQQQEEDLQLTAQEAKELLEKISSELKNVTRKTYDKESTTVDDESFVIDDDCEKRHRSSIKNGNKKLLVELRKQEVEQKEIVKNTSRAILSWRESHNNKIEKLGSNCNQRQRELKAMCAKVHNEYSTKCIQEDFVSGLKEMYRDAQESQGDEKKNISLPIDTILPVFCISANDYFKLTG